jgi:2-desacetyl-2-hydroxyethyl bacteriochlorophyllide A dehydrogenase
MYDSEQVIFTAPRQAVIVKTTIDEPGEGQILTRTLFTLISTGTELTAYSGDFPPNSFWARYVQYPWTAGYSHVGEVIAVGPGVTGIQAGQHVDSLSPHASLVLQKADQVRVIPSAVPDEVATFQVISTVTLNGIHLANIALGEAVVIVGAGLLGQLATRYAYMCGARPLIVVDLAEGRLELARTMGATHTLVASNPNVIEMISGITKGRLADVAFEVTGSPQVIPSLFKMVRRRGRVILLGSPRGKTEIDFGDEVHTLGLQIIGAHNSVHTPVETPYNTWTHKRDDELFFDLVAAGELDIARLISHRYPWREAPAAYEMLYADRTKAMGVILDWRER